jgi:hypothetical protein
MKSLGPAPVALPEHEAGLPRRDGSGTLGRTWDASGTVARVRIARVYRAWDGGTAVQPQGTPPAPTRLGALFALFASLFLARSPLGTAWHGSRHGLNLKNLPCLPGLSRCHGSTGVHTPPHALHYPKPPFAFAHALMHCNQRARSKNKCQSSPLTLLKLTRSCPQLSVKRTVLDGFGDVITNYSI